MKKNNRQRTVELVSKTNQDLDDKAKLLIVDGNEKIDLLEVSPTWIKLRSKSTKKTFSVEKDKYVNIVVESVKAVRDNSIEIESLLKSQFKKSVEIQKISDQYFLDVAENVSQWWDDLVSKILEVGDIPSLLGPYKDLERRITIPRDLRTGEPLDPEAQLKICKVGKIYMFFEVLGSQNLNNGKEIWKFCLPPPAACGSQIAKKLDVSETEENQTRSKGLDYLLEKDSTLDGIDIDMNENSMIALDETDIVSDVSNSSCAARRMKLFAAAKHYGADIFQRDGWIAAVCWTYEQCHVFGRLKPKVKPGTNEIDPDCNLEDWEGITPENKAKRDDWSLPWIEDHIDDNHGHYFDRLSGESGQPKKSFGCETAWCNCGVLNGDGTWIARDSSNPYFRYYNNGGKTPYLILMDMSRGALYQYVHMKNHGDIVNFLNEDDKTDGGSLGNPPDVQQMVFFKEFCEENSKFADFITELDAKFY